jgi:hypothetical protein
MKKITAAKKKEITNAWAQEFPELTVYKNMWLMRRVGPLLQGICLEKDSTNSNYLPTFHVHNLIGQEEDFISLSLKTVLVKANGTPQRITEMQHDKECQNYIQQFKKQVPFNFAGKIKLKQVVKAYEEELSSGRADVKYPINQWYDLISLYLWCNKLKYAQKLFEKAKNSIEQWPEDVTKYMPDRIQKFMNLESFFSSSDELKKKVDIAINELKLEDLNFTELA